MLKDCRYRRGTDIADRDSRTVFIAYSNQATARIHGHDNARTSEFVDTIHVRRNFVTRLRARKEFNDTIRARRYSEISEFLKGIY